MADQEIVGPLDPVECMAIQYEGQRIDSEVTRLGAILENLKRSVLNTEREVASLKDRRVTILREILKRRGVDPGARSFREQVLPNGTLRILIG